MTSSALVATAACLPGDRPRVDVSPEMVGALAALCLTLEAETWPKPGLVSRFDSGSHGDMDIAMLRRSARVLQPFFAALCAAGMADRPMSDLRAIGLSAEAAMLDATGGVNTHRGAIFGLGLLCAAAGRRETGLGLARRRLGAIVARLWAPAIRSGPVALSSHGTSALRRFGATGARGEAIAGFPSLYTIGLPALNLGRRLAPGDEEAARVQAVFALIAGIDDTNLLHRGGGDGLAFAHAATRAFLREGGVGAAYWREDAVLVHERFVDRRLSPGGAADLLAMTLFLDVLDPPGTPDDASV